MSRSLTSLKCHGESAFQVRKSKTFELLGVFLDEGEECKKILSNANRVVLVEKLYFVISLSATENN